MPIDLELHIWTSYLNFISELHIWTSYLNFISELHIWTSYLHFISELHICTSYLSCLDLWKLGCPLVSFLGVYRYVHRPMYRLIPMPMDLEPHIWTSYLSCLDLCKRNNFCWMNQCLSFMSIKSIRCVDMERKRSSDMERKRSSDMERKRSSCLSCACQVRVECEDMGKERDLHVY